MSEQTIQNDLYSYNVSILDKYECLNLGATTIRNLMSSKKIRKYNIFWIIDNFYIFNDYRIIDSVYNKCKWYKYYNSKNIFDFYNIMVVEIYELYNYNYIFWKISWWRKK